jgi:hypothetical protein
MKYTITSTIPKIRNNPFPVKNDIISIDYFLDLFLKYRNAKNAKINIIIYGKFCPIA